MIHAVLAFYMACYADIYVGAMQVVLSMASAVNYVTYHVAAFAASPFILASLRDLIVPVTAMLGLATLPMAHPRTRRVSFAVTHYAKRHAPRWLVPLLIACAFIPGPVDELLVIGAALYPVLRTPYNRRVFARTVRYAWAR